VPASDGNGWEDSLKRGMERKPPPPPPPPLPPAGPRPVRLSDLAPPSGQAPGGARPSVPSAPGLPGRPAAPNVPLRPPGRLPQGSPVSRPAPLARDDVGRLRAELKTSEDARRQAEARVAELEREMTGLLAGVPSAAGGNGHAEVEQLRRELEEAHTIIRAIEQAYLAGGGEPASDAGPAGV